MGSGPTDLREAPMRRNDPAPEFWRCASCKTPNPRASYLTLCITCGAPRPADPAPRPEPASRPRPCVRGRTVLLACWLYAAGTLGLLLALRGLGDRHWAGTLLLYAPRWPYALPLVGLVPAAALKRRAALIPLALSALVLVGPVMGFRVPWGRLLGATPRGPRLRIMTCNAQSGHADPERLGDAVTATDPDVLLGQEWSGGPPLPSWWTRGRHERLDGGLFISSRYPIRSAEVLVPRGADWRKLAVVYELETPEGPLFVVNIHLDTPREGIEAFLHAGFGGLEAIRINTDTRLAQSEAVALRIADLGGPLVIAGDFNMPTDSAIFRRAWSAYPDAFDAAGWGFGRSKFTGWHGIRIDHVLSGPGLAARRCWVGPDVGSDHRPVIADLVPANPKPG